MAVDSIPESKICTKCRLEKPVIEFYRRIGKRCDTFQSWCKSCAQKKTIAWNAANVDKVKKTTAAYRADNVEKRRATTASYRSANRQKVRAANAKWAAANLDRVRATKAAYRAANPEKARAASSKWERANPEKLRIKNHNRRAKVRKNGGKLSADLSVRLYKLQKGKCACGCKQPLGDKYHLDHIMPIALGGVNEDFNIQLLRQFCNIQKHAKHPIDFMQQKGFLL